MSSPSAIGEKPLTRFDRTVATTFAALAVVAALLYTAGLLSPNLNNVLRYERDGVLHGEVWRFLTGHFVHADFQHLALNLAGTLLTGALFTRSYTPRQWLVILLASVITMSIGFVVLEPQLAWYVGLSGVLHGALAAGAVAWWRSESRLAAAVLTLFLVVKLAWEQWQGALPLMSGVPVIVDAHLYGAIGGVMAAMWFSRTASQTGRATSL